MGFYDSIDADWTWNGDYIIGDDGDIGDTEYDLLKSLETEIATVVKADALDWEKDPFIGANLDDFLGEPNTRETGQAIEERVSLAITTVGLVDNGDLEVRVVPITAHQLMIMITVYAMYSSGNRLNERELVSVNLVYDTLEKDLFFFPTPNKPF